MEWLLYALLLFILILLISYAYASFSFAPWVPCWRKDLKRIFKLANLQAGEVFYDLGCGVGKPVIAGALLKPFGKCIGVELLPGLYKRACEIKQRFDKEFKPTIEGHRADISFINKDLLDVDISSGDVFYLAATCFNDNLIEAITKKTKDVKVGSRFMMLSKQIHDRSLFLQWASVKKMGWGDEILYIYKKIH